MVRLQISSHLGALQGLEFSVIRKVRTGEIPSVTSLSIHAGIIIGSQDLLGFTVKPV